MLCPRCCGADRAAGERGYCGMGALPVVARAAAHFWEEPCISGTRGSGAVFFSGCSLGCVFCQNREISRGGVGREVTPERLREIYFRLAGQGVHNINLVTASHFTDVVAPTLDGLPLPVVWNSGGYELPQTLALLEGRVKIFLPDMKYSVPSLAARFSGAPDYPEVAKKAIETMYEMAGPTKYGDGGLLESGVLVRHLLLPDGLLNAKGVMSWVKKRFGGKVAFSLMRQYTPPSGVELPPPLQRKIAAREYSEAADYLENIGITEGWLQEESSAAEEYVPPFDLTGI